MTGVPGLEESYRRYIAGYPRAVLEALAAKRAVDFESLGFWRFPLLSISTAGARIVTEQEFDARFHELYVKYSQDGWVGGVRITGIEVQPVCASFARLDGRGDRVRGDGSVIDRWATYYLMALGSEGWRAVALAGTGVGLPAIERWCGWFTGLEGRWSEVLTRSDGVAPPRGSGMVADDQGRGRDTTSGERHTNSE